MLALQSYLESRLYSKSLAAFLFRLKARAKKGQMVVKNTGEILRKCHPRLSLKDVNSALLNGQKLHHS